MEPSSSPPLKSRYSTLPTVSEEITFTPFTSVAVLELKSWIEHDQPLDVLTAFGPSVLAKTTVPLKANPGFLDNLLHPPENGPAHLSMLVTIRTSYHSLLNIGYVQLTPPNKSKMECTINYLYISKPFRYKDYEYKTFQKIIEFVMTDLRCERCFIWVDEGNYLFLSLAKTLKLKLVKIGTRSGGAGGSQKRYCYMVGRVKSTAMNNYLFRKYAICIDSLPESPRSVKPVTTKIEDYMEFKSKLHEINKIHEKTSPATKKSTIYYSPVVKTTRETFSKDVTTVSPPGSSIPGKGLKSVGAQSPQLRPKPLLIPRRAAKLKGPRQSDITAAVLPSRVVS